MCRNINNLLFMGYHIEKEKCNLQFIISFFSFLWRLYALKDNTSKTLESTYLYSFKNACVYFSYFRLYLANT